MKVGKEKYGEETTTKEIPWILLQKLIMLDCRARDSHTLEPQQKDLNPKVEDQQEERGELDDLDFDEILTDLDIGTESMNPLDLMVVIFGCCDLNLRQILFQKMFHCRLALPLIYPQLSNDTLCFSLWALRGIVAEWRNTDNEAFEHSLVSQPLKIVSFVRVGRPKFSKSKCLNNLISDTAHDTFFNADCQNGNTKKVFSDGLVEASVYLPSGKDTDAFSDVTLLLNLRGDATDNERQVRLLSKLFNVVVACTDMSGLADSNITSTMGIIHQNASDVVLLLLEKDPGTLSADRMKQIWSQYAKEIGKENLKNTKRIFGFQGKQEKNANMLKREILGTLGKCLEKVMRKTVLSFVQLVKEINIDIDEMDPNCQVANDLADRIISLLSGKSAKDIKKEMLPLQGELWHEWCNLLKAHNRYEGTHHTLQEKGKIKSNMKTARQKQMQICNNLSPLMKAFKSTLESYIDTPIVMFFLQWLKLYFDQLSRETLPQLRQVYLEKWGLYSKAKEAEPEGNLEGLKNDARNALQALTDSSLGLEHLFREIGQIYEVALECGITLQTEARMNLEKLPKTVAKLLLKGCPIELMDGDSSCVPLTWVKAVLDHVEKIVPNQRIFTLSVLGLQSSGKSTLLNTMFGLEFPVSAGRCTKGVYMQLVKVDMKSHLPFDYVVVLDTEGLRAPELGDSKHNHDNELATFIIGLGDVTLMNIKGENLSEIEDILQIVVHAFLRMGIVNQAVQKARTCIFIHQNVAALNAKDKMMHCCHRLKENLDEITKVAASAEHMDHNTTFNQILGFDAENHIWYFSDLWKGDPPMAAANPGYHLKVQEVKTYIFKDFAKNHDIVTRFPDLNIMIKDIWQGVLHDDFVFSFRKSLALQAYSRLEEKFCNLKWSLQLQIQEWCDKNVKRSLNQCTSTMTWKQSTRTSSNNSRLRLIRKGMKKWRSLRSSFRMMITKAS